MSERIDDPTFKAYDQAIKEVYDKDTFSFGGFAYEKSGGSTFLQTDQVPGGAVEVHPNAAAELDAKRLQQEVGDEYDLRSSPHDRIQKPTLPPGEDIDANIEKAKNMSLADFINSVRGGGQWDYKESTKNIKPNPFEGPGNMNYGATAKSMGFPDPIIKMAAGAYQIYQGHSKPEWGGPRPYPFLRSLPDFIRSVPSGVLSYGMNKYGGVLTNQHHGDEPEDQYNIEQGIKYYDQYQREKNGFSK